MRALKVSPFGNCLPTCLPKRSLRAFPSVTSPMRSRQKKPWKFFSGTNQPNSSEQQRLLSKAIRRTQLLLVGSDIQTTKCAPSSVLGWNKVGLTSRWKEVAIWTTICVVQKSFVTKLAGIASWWWMPTRSGTSARQFSTCSNSLNFGLTGLKSRLRRTMYVVTLELLVLSNRLALPQESIVKIEWCSNNCCRPMQSVFVRSTVVV